VAGALFVYEETVPLFPHKVSFGFLELDRRHAVKFGGFFMPTKKPPIAHHAISGQKSGIESRGRSRNVVTKLRVF
jgi:hypothetical protein